MNPRHHVRPGQPLRLAAEQVNGLNRLLNLPGGTQGLESVRQSLPQSVGIFELQGIVAGGRAMLGEAFLVQPPSTAINATTAANAVHPNGILSIDSVRNAGEPERYVFSHVLPRAISTTPVSRENIQKDHDPAIAICVEHDSCRLAYAGFALCRVRVFSGWHRHARPPVTCGLNDELVPGCLDSCAHGPVRICGYFQANETSDWDLKVGLNPGDTTNPPPAYPQNFFSWALVQL